MRVPIKSAWPVFLLAVVLGGGLLAPGCGPEIPAGELEVTYYYLPG